MNPYKKMIYKQAGFEDGPPPPFSAKGSKKRVLTGTGIGALIGGALGKSMFEHRPTIGALGMGALGAGIGSLSGLAYHNHTKLHPEKQRLNSMINEYHDHGRQMRMIADSLPNAELKRNLQENIDELTYLEQNPDSYIDGQPTKELKDSRSIVYHTTKELEDLERQTLPYVQNELGEIERHRSAKDRLYEDIQKQRSWLKPQLMFKNPRDV